MLLPEHTGCLKLQDDPDILRHLADVDWATAYTGLLTDQRFSPDTVRPFVQQVLA
jgi:hypothetical protein